MTTSVAVASAAVSELTYRGYPVEELCRHCTFEEVAYLRWHGELPDRNEIAVQNRAERSQRVIDSYVATMLAAVIIVAVLGLIDVATSRRLWAWRRSEFALTMVAFAGVALLGVLWGVGIAIAVSLLSFIQRAWRPHDAVLGRVDSATAEARTAVLDAVRNIHALLDDQQREKLATLLDQGWWRGRGGGGPYRV